MQSGPPTFIELARRRQIIDAAIATISDLGLGKASIAAIATRAGVSAALISYHFGSRQGLVDAVLETIQADIDRAMEAESEDESYPAALEGMLRRFVRHCIANLPATLVLTRFRHQAADLGKGQEGSRSAGINELITFFQEGQRYGQFRAADASVLAAVLFDAMTDLPAELARRTPDDRASFEREWPALFVRAIAVEEPPTEPNQEGKP